MSDGLYSSPEANEQRKISRTERPCDTCRKRKSKCVREPGQAACVLCAFHQRQCTYLDEPSRRKRKRVEEGFSQRTPSVTDETSAFWSTPAPPLLDQTLGLHRSTHSMHIGQTSPFEPRLSHLLRRPNAYRRVAEHTTFGTKADSDYAFAGNAVNDLDAVEKCVGPYGLRLIHLYFRIIHPSYPILHKGVFLEKYYRTHRDFSPPLLAAMYLLAMDWWEFDNDLCNDPKPETTALIKLATRLMNEYIQMPKLGTVQAGLLLLQRSGGDSWILTSQVVAVAEELGLHKDCSSWQIPEWEKGLRRRLASAVYMQDKWASLNHGRPSHISKWAGFATLDDFPESAADEDDKDGSTGVETGRLLFLHLLALTQILSRTLEAADETTRYTLDRAKVITMSLREWTAKMPSGLQMEDFEPRKLCSNGYLHLSYIAVEITSFRDVIRHIEPETPEKLRELCRDAAKARLSHAMDFIEKLRPEHLQSFWWFASSKCLVLIASFCGLLWITSRTDAEGAYYKEKLDEFKWSLKVRSKGILFISTALTEIEQCVPSSESLRHNDTNLPISPMTVDRRAALHQSPTLDLSSYLGLDDYDLGGGVSSPFLITDDSMFAVVDSAASFAA